jgi:hypothetical protein
MPQNSLKDFKYCGSENATETDIKQYKSRELVFSDRQEHDNKDNQADTEINKLAFLKHFV